MAFNGEDFAKLNIDFSKFDKIIFDRLPLDVANSQKDKADLFDLIQQFKEKSECLNKVQIRKNSIPGFTGN
jgi:Xaa-Pro aminopeptidase